MKKSTTLRMGGTYVVELEISLWLHYAWQWIQNVDWPDWYEIITYGGGSGGFLIWWTFHDKPKPPRWPGVNKRERLP